MLQGYSICFNEWALNKDIKSELGLLLIVSSLTAEKGYCYASNDYLAKLFNIDEVTISRKLSKLVSKGYIKIDYKRRGAEVVNREIRLTKMLTDDLQKSQSTINKNVKDNNISSNNINKKETLTNLVNSVKTHLLNKSALMEWLEFKKYNYQKIGVEKLVKMLIEYSYENQQKIVDTSIRNNWKGLFDIKVETKPKQNNSNYMSMI